MCDIVNRAPGSTPGGPRADPGRGRLSPDTAGSLSSARRGITRIVFGCGGAARAICCEVRRREATAVTKPPAWTPLDQ